MFGRFRRRPPLDVVDLTGDPDFVLDLMARPRSWRERQVEEMELGSAATAAGSSRRVVVTSGYQVRLPDGMEQRLGVLRARVQLPLTRRAKVPYLDFDLRGPGGTPVTLLPGGDVADISTQHLFRLARASLVTDRIVALLPGDLLRAICRATPGGYRQLVAREGKDGALAEYLRLTLGLQARLADLRRWEQLLVAPGQALAARLHERPSLRSTSENPLLALPRLSSRLRPTRTDEIDALVRDYREAVLAADSGQGGVFLEALAEYGRRTDVIVELEAPLDEAFTVKMTELRPFRLSRNGRISERFRFDDARSVHLRAQVESHWIEVAGYAVRDTDGNEVEFPVLVDELATEKSVTVTSYREDRPRIVDVELQLRTSGDVRWTLWSVMALAWTSAGAAVLLPTPEQLGDLVDTLGLLAVPTTFAVSLAVTREESSLAARLQRGIRTSLLLATTVLWTAVLYRLAAAFL